jgi:hypothetical protein
MHDFHKGYDANNVRGPMEEDTTGSYIVHCSDSSPICPAHLSLSLLSPFAHFLPL